MLPPQTNFAFIDSQNINLEIKKLGWNLDWKKFRIYLKEKYGVANAFLFLGYMEENRNLYQSLRKSGYVIVFKETLKNHDGTVKGNCDAELVLQAMIEYDNYEKAVIVTGDGDFACLVRYLLKMIKLERVLVPNENAYSILLKRNAPQSIDFLNKLRKRLEYMKSTQ